MWYFNTEISKLQGTAGMGGAHCKILVPLCLEVSKRVSPMGSGYLTFPRAVLHFWGSHSDAAALTSESLKESLGCNVFPAGRFWWDVWKKPYLSSFCLTSLLLGDDKNKPLHPILGKTHPTVLLYNRGSPWWRRPEMKGEWAWNPRAETRSLHLVSCTHSSRTRPSIILSTASAHLWEFPCILNELHKMFTSLP